jgi:hypothetical protein
MALLLSIGCIFTKEANFTIEAKYKNPKFANFVRLFIGYSGVIFTIIFTIILILKWDEVTTLGRINLF